MRKTISKLMAVVLSASMTFSSVICMNVNIKADMTTQEMVADSQYNLALKKTVQVEPSMQEGTVACLTDGKFTPGGDHAATTFNQKGTSYQIDLGKPYDLSTLDELVIGYKENNDGDIPVKGYTIQISTNGLDFTDAKKVDGKHVKEACTNNNLIEVTSLSDAVGKAARYIRLYYPDAYGFGIQITEFAVLDTDKNATEAEVEKCADAAGIKFSTPDYNTVAYTIEAGENQEDYKYIVYLLNGVNDRIIGNGVEAGKEYRVENLFSGFWTIKVIACYNGAASDGITTERFEIPEIGNVIREKRNISNASYPNYYPAKIVEMKSFYEGHTLETAQVALDSVPNIGEGPTVAMRTDKGSPQYFVVDLGEYYNPQEMLELMVLYSNANTYASNVKVEFSLDGKKYTEVGNKKNYIFAAKSANFCAYNRIKLDAVSNDTDKAVRYMKVTLSGGSSAYGYVINEVCLLADSDEPTIVGSNIPEAADVKVDTSDLEKIKYTIVPGENQEDATYIVSLDGININTEAKPGVEYEYNDLEAGTYEIKVSNLEAGWQSKGIKRSIVVDGYSNYVGTSLNLALKSKHNTVTAVCDNDNKKPNYLTGSQDISAGVWALNNGVWTDYAHHTGYLQTRPDNDEANIVYDLGKEYNKDDIKKVIAMYESTKNAATEYEIYVSANMEDETFEKVFYAKDVKFKTFRGETRPVYTNDKLDMSAYTQNTVRYVKYHIITGNYGRHYNADGSINWGSDGYHLCELAVMGSDKLLPDAPANVSATSPKYNTVVVKWDDIEDENAVYNIYIDGALVATEKSGVNEKTITAREGEHKVKVSACVNEIEKNSEEVAVYVKMEPTTKPPKTTGSNDGNNNSNSGNNNEKNANLANNELESNATTVVAEEPADTNSKEESKLAIVKNVKVKVTKKKISVKYKKVNGANGYRIKYSFKSNFKKAKIVSTKQVNVVLKNLKKGKKYYIKVQAYKVIDGKKIYGNYSKVVISEKVK